MKRIVTNRTYDMKRELIDAICKRAAVNRQSKELFGGKL